MSTATNWYENLEHGTFHEVIEGTDTERRMKSEQRTLVEADTGEEYQAPAFRKVTAKQAQASPASQPGYVKDGATEAPVQTPASPVGPVQSGARQTPTADTAKGLLIGEPGAEEQAAEEIKLGGAAPAGVKPSATAAKRTAAQAQAGKVQDQ